MRQGVLSLQLLPRPFDFRFDLALRRHVAIKTLPRVSPEFAVRLRREARAMAAVVHPNLAFIYGAETWGGVPMLIFEYLAGGHLFPLNILPPVVAQALEYTPFPYLLFFPVSIYLGQRSGAELWHGLLIQAGWVLLAYGLARFVWSRGIKKYSAVGG